MRVVVTNRKGGVGKSSVTVGIAGTLAASGMNVLIVDLDPQRGNLTNTDLGLEDTSDNGRNLAMVCQYGVGEGVRLEPLSTGRTNLDVIAGGLMLKGMATAMAAQGNGSDTLGDNLDAALSEVADRCGYQVVILDTPPGDDSIVPRALMGVCDWLLIPTNEDDGSITGIRQIAAEFLRAQEEGATIDLLGIVLFGINPQATARNLETRADIDALMSTSGQSFVFDSYVRNAKAAAKDLRKRHVLPAELVDVGNELRKNTLGRLREGRKVTERLWSANGQAVAEDYQRITKEMLMRIKERSVNA